MGVFGGSNVTGIPFPTGPSIVVRDQRTSQPIVRDHRTTQPQVRDHREGAAGGTFVTSGGVTVTTTPAGSRGENAITGSGFDSLGLLGYR
jgi:hypothetical protein